METRVLLLVSILQPKALREEFTRCEKFVLKRMDTKP